MQLTYLRIHNLKSIQSMEIWDIERVLILVRKDNTGKISMLNAVCTMCGCYKIQDGDFNENRRAVRINACFSIEEEGLHLSHHMGIVSQYRRHDMWRRVFSEQLPSFQDGELSFTFHVDQDGKVRYGDPYRKNNLYIHTAMPRVYRVNVERELSQLQNNLLVFQEDEELRRLRSGNCTLERAKECSHCFQCIGLTNRKKPEELPTFEMTRLLELKVYQMNLSGFPGKINENFFENGEYEEVQYMLSCDVDQLFNVEVTARSRQRGTVKPVGLVEEGIRSTYMLSLLETYTSEQGRAPSTTVVEDPEIFLHSRSQKTCSEILYRLSKKNQVTLKTHNPDLSSNFNIRQIRQVALGDERYLIARPRTNTSEILDDLGCGADDLLNVSFVFIVEGRQDKSRLPLLLGKHYFEIYDEEENLYRTSIIATDSCTNIRAYTSLKCMNQAYLWDQFPMICGGDDKGPEELASQLCRYYDERSLESMDRLPKVIRKNVLILKYYSFENYFSNSAAMTHLGIVESEGVFYRTLYGEWREYLYRIRSRQQPMKALGRDFSSPEDMKEHMEEVHTFPGDHNLYDILYGPLGDREKEVLRVCIDLAPKEDFKDILDAINRLVYFDSRKGPKDERQAEGSMI